VEKTKQRTYVRTINAHRVINLPQYSDLEIFLTLPCTLMYGGMVQSPYRRVM